MTTPIWAVIAGACLLAGCAFRPQTTGMAVDYNEFVAQATNRQTVLNILRASRREPMHFTSFSEVVGTIRGGGTATAGGALNGDAGSLTRADTVVANTGATGAATGGSVTGSTTRADNFGATNLTPSLALTVSTGTDFKVAANASDEFYKGILNPLPTATVVNYLRQGFPSDLLSHLLIGRLDFFAEVIEPGKKPVRLLLKGYPNNPDESESARLFAAAIRCRTLDYSLDPVEERRLVFSDLSSMAPITPDMLGRLQEAEGSTPGQRQYEVVTPARDSYNLALSEPDVARCQETRADLETVFLEKAKSEGYKPVRPHSAATVDVIVDDDKLSRNASDVRGDQIEADAEKRTLGRSDQVTFTNENYFTLFLPYPYQANLIIDITFRSVEGVIYYLGAYIRDPRTSPRLSSPICGGRYCMPVIDVRPADEIDPGERFVEVTYRGKRYAVPLSGAALSESAGRSSQVIGLIQQLLNLNRSAKDLPSTPLVRVYN